VYEDLLNETPVMATVELEDVLDIVLDEAHLANPILPEDTAGPERDQWHKAELKKGLYGLKQAGREWYATLHDFLIHFGFRRMLTTLFSMSSTRH
jgi:hypothetical protein